MKQETSLSARTPGLRVGTIFSVPNFTPFPHIEEQQWYPLIDGYTHLEDKKITGTTRLARRNAVTIALAVNALDGVVVAADRQETSGDQKKDQGKIVSQWKADPPGHLIITGSGNAAHIDALSAQQKRITGAGDPDLKWEPNLRAQHLVFMCGAFSLAAFVTPPDRW